MAQDEWSDCSGDAAHGESASPQAPPVQWVESIEILRSPNTYTAPDCATPQLYIHKKRDYRLFGTDAVVSEKMARDCIAATLDSLVAVL